MHNANTYYDEKSLVITIIMCHCSNNSYISQRVQHEPKGKCSLGNSNYRLHPFKVMLFKIKDLVAKQHLTNWVKLRVHQNQRTNNMGSLVRKYKF